MERLTRSILLVPILLAAIAFAGCLGDSNPAAPGSGSPTDGDDTNLENVDLSSENGGYNEANEDPDSWSDAILKAEETVDATATVPLPGQAALEADPSYEVYFLRIAWGQLDGDSSNTTPTDWSGSVSLDRGGLAVQRAICFEPNDYIVRPRMSRLSVEFVSETTVHYDGLLLRIYHPLDDTASTPNRITFQTGPFTQSFDVKDLDGLSVVYDVDALGNQVSFRGAKRPPLPCLNGYLVGFWMTNTEETRGRFGGVWVEQDGRAAGFLRGHFGVNDEGERVLFGKYISMAGHFKGILRGTYEPNGDGTGEFSGRWHGRGGRLEGEFSGTYSVGLATGQDPALLRGRFEGGWKTNCTE